MRRIEAQWLSYRHLVIPKDAQPIQIQECRRAFYAGAEGLLSAIFGMLSPDADATEKDFVAMEDIQSELNEFAEQVKQGAA